MSDEEEDFVSFGNPLKELVEGENIRKRPISVEEQIATDNNGKRRFHGAFTGGFSAGHFNTVDTPQGWTPSQFKSSRESKAERGGQRPEDFMDDEDFGAFGFAPHSIKTKSNFQSKNDPARSNGGGGVEGPSAPLAPVLTQLVQSTNSTVGERLLRKQGWKPGQGIGPKSSNKLKQDRKTSYVKTYGGKEDERTEDPILDKYREFLFAPDDLPVYVANPKENLFGIGYRGLDRPGAQPAAVSSSAFNLKSGVSRKKFSITGEAFGVGAYEEEDDDVYNRNDMGDYDYALDVGGDTGKKKKDNRTADVSKLSDMLEGFVMSTRKSMLKKQFPAPQIPRDWRPTTQGYVRKSRFEKVDEKEAIKIQNPTRDQRRAALFPDRADRAEPVKTEPLKTEDIKEEPLDTDFLKNAVSAIDQSNFKPFAAKPEKQKRYDQFLVCIENNRRDALRILQPKTMTEWERERERVEFEKAAALYKPMRLNMASRFVSAGTSNEESTENSAEGEKRKAAELKMFGKLTRDTAEWVPARILCVRFNVKNPFGDHKEAENKKKKKDFVANQLFSVLDSREPSRNQDAAAGADNSSNNGVGHEVKKEVPVKVILVKDEEVEIKTEKPPMDLFKAIFANSDSEDEESEDSEPEKESSRLKKPPDPDSEDSSSRGPRPMFNSSVNRSSAPNTDSARGIFAGINFDKFVRKRKKTPPPVVREKVAKHRPKSILDRSVRNILGIKSGDQSDDDYGPPLPPPAVPVKSIVISSGSESDEWEEKSKKKKSKSKKHKKEKKKKKKKHKSRD